MGAGRSSSVRPSLRGRVRATKPRRPGRHPTGPVTSASACAWVGDPGHARRRLLRGRAGRAREGRGRKGGRSRTRTRDERDEARAARAAAAAAEVEADPSRWRARSCSTRSPVRPAPARSWPTSWPRGTCRTTWPPQLLDRFEEVGLVDDEAFARAWIECRHRSQGLAPRALAQELRRKGIHDEDAKAALDEIDADDEDAAARALVRKKLRRMRGLDHQVATRRLVGMLARKGYSARAGVRRRPRGARRTPTTLDAARRRCERSDRGTV